MSAKFTQWFATDVKPTLPGVYEVKSPHGTPGPWFAYWDGERFGYRYLKSKRGAYTNRHEHTGLPGTATWRGLASDPSKKQK